MKVLCRFALACVVAVACGGPVLAGSVREAIEAANASFDEAYNGGDAAKVAALYAEDAAILPPNANRANGRAEIQAFWKGAIDAGISDVALKTLEVEEAGDLAFETGEASLSMPVAGGAKRPCR